MYIKTTRSKKYQYLQLVESYREKDAVKHKVLMNLGRLDQISKQSLACIGTKLLELSGMPQALNSDACSDAKISNWGYVVYKKLWEKFKLPAVLSAIQNDKKTQFDFNNSCFLMAVQHLLAPASKLATYREQQQYAKLDQVDLNHLYRALDIASSNKDKIEMHVFKTNCALYNMRIDVVFYDVTTFRFESVNKDDLRAFGFSKDCKFNEVQVVFGMMIDSEGRPIGYELFPGNTYEGKTLEKALDKIEKRFGIRNVIIVADRGLNSKINLKRLADRKYGYIVASRIKNMSKEIQAKILDKSGYEVLNKEENIRYKIFDYINTFQDEAGVVKLEEKLLITYSEKRAKKDHADRQRLLDKAEYLLQNKSLIKNNNKRGGKKYLKETGNTNWALDTDAIKKDEQYDGYYGIQTSEKNLSPEKIMGAYHTLWKIEESFRIMKSTLEVRPIFHWTEKRIHGHFVICFLAFLMERTLELELRKAAVQASPMEIRSALNSLRFAELNIEGKQVFIKTQNTELASQILKILKIKSHKNITTGSEVTF